MNGKNSIPLGELERIAREAGCDIEEQASYLKVSKNGEKEQLLYIARSINVSRVDLSGFELNEPEVVNYLGGEKQGRVHYQLRFDKPAKVIRAHFRQLCKGLGKFKSLPKSPRGRPVGLNGSKKRGVTSVVVIQPEKTTQETIDILVQQLDEKRALAKKMGSALSKKTELEFITKIEELRKQLNP